MNDRNDKLKRVKVIMKEEVLKRGDWNEWK